MMANIGYSDRYTTNDELGFASSAEALAGIISESVPSDTPLTIGIYGEWGSGKTSLMHMIEDALVRERTPTVCVPIWFEAWRYAQEHEALWRALLLCIVAELRHRLTDQSALHALLLPGENPQEVRATINAQLDLLQDRLYRSVEQTKDGDFEFRWDEAGKLVVKTAFRLGAALLPAAGLLTKFVDKAIEKGGEESGDDLLGLVRRKQSEIYHEQIQALDQFQVALRDLIRSQLTNRGCKVVLFIDDLARCLPEQAIGVLEAIKVFLDIEGCVFVIGVDRQIIERGIRVRYKEFALDAASAERAGQQGAAFPIEGRDYLEKIVQLPFDLPPLTSEAIRAFLDGRLRGVPDLSQEQARIVAQVMTDGLRRNPRKVKRTYNAFRLLWRLNRANQRGDDPGHLAKLVVLQSSYPTVYEAIVASPNRLLALESEARGLAVTQGVSEKDRDWTKELLVQPPLKQMLSRDPLLQQLGEERLRSLIFQTRMTAGSTG
jgi:hypothetical protein